MNDEAYCADKLRLLESEYFIAVGDHCVAKTLNPDYASDIRMGIADPLPDLLSVKRENQKTLFRLREVKFKLEERLVRKALRQLESGMKCLAQSIAAPMIDRIEIVLPLRERKLKAAELKFLGAQICTHRFQLNFEEKPYLRNEEGQLHWVTVLLL